MTYLDGHLYMANTDAPVRVAYRLGQTRITAAPEIVTHLPAAPLDHHWTKGLIERGGRLHVSVGSNSDHGENGLDAERGRAAIWEIDPATGAATIHASGLRNPVGMDVEPGSGVLWTVVNERDELGDNLVPDYLTPIREGDWCGWPFL